MSECETIQGSSEQKLRELFDGPRGQDLTLHLVGCEPCSDWVLATIVDSADAPLAAEAPSPADVFFRAHFCCH